MSPLKPSIPPAVILAAGRGNRLLPLTVDRPKCLLDIGGKTILEHQIRALRMAGVETVQVVTGHGAELVKEHCNGSTLYAHNAEFDTTNSFDSLGCLTLEIGDAGLLILNSDVLFHPSLLQKLLADPAPNALLADFRDDFGDEEMKIVVDETNRLRQITKKMDPSLAQAENLGIIKLGADAARRMVELSRTPERESWIRWVPDGLQFLRDDFDIRVIPIGGVPWTEIDFAEDLQTAREDIYPKLHSALW